jgi:hypothetical protein
LLDFLITGEEKPNGLARNVSLSMMHLALATTAVLITWFFVATMLIGLGFELIALVRLPEPSTQPLFTAFWFGFALLLFLLQCWHFLFRISALPWILFSIAALPGLWNSRMLVARSLASIKKKPVLLCLGVLGVLYAANRAIGPCIAVDAGLYGRPAINWFVAYPLVPGLSNLNERIGFNNSIFLFYAMLDHGFWQARSHQLVNGLLLAALLLQIISSSVRLFDRHNPEHSSDLFEAVLLVPAVAIAIDQLFFNISSITTDTAATIVMFIGAARLFRIFDSAAKQWALDGFFVVFVLAAAVTIKLTALGFAMTAALLVFWNWLKVRDTERFAIWPAAALAASASGLILIAWLGRGVILSGYLVYPETSSALNVDWRVPQTIAVREGTFIREFSRYYFDVDGVEERVARGQNSFLSVSWVRPWVSTALSYFKGEITIPTALALVGLVFIAVSLIDGSFADTSRIALLAFVPPVALLIQSLLLSPHPRFMMVGLWVVASVALSLGLRPYVLRSVIVRRAALVGTIFLAVFLIAARARNYFSRHRPADALAALFNGPGPDNGFYPLPQPADLGPFVTHSGLTVLYPIHKGLIWNGPLLSAPTPELGLELRVAGSLRDGFRTAIDSTQAAAK